MKKNDYVCVVKRAPVVGGSRPVQCVLLHGCLGWGAGIGSGGTHTCEGTRPLWTFLERSGLVRKIERSPFGHPFNYAPTAAGAARIEELCSESNAVLENNLLTA
jgi:hypothetical protein